MISRGARRRNTAGTLLGAPAGLHP
jgi:hypothetical protein